ncbi:MAG: J domain-containing protein [Chloroflexi bacterium]|nr:J domain-containing protein [Chloroflexota bacterium]
MEFQDYYKILGVPRTASQAEIKKAYRKLARESHPDRHAGDKAAEQRFKEVNEAHAVLSDPAKRAKYDQFGKDWEAYARAGAGAGGGGANPFGPGGPFAGWSTFGGGPAGGRGGSGTGPGGIRYEFRTSGDPGAFSDFFRMMFGDESAAAGEPETFRAGPGLDEFLSRMGYGAAGGATGQERVGGRGTGAGQPRLAPIDVTAEVSLEEAFHGTSRIVDIDGRRREVTIPRGVDTGSRIRLTGKGPEGRDLVVVVRVKPHPVFTRRGADLEREVPVTLREALLGGEVPVPTLKGRVLLTLPPATQSGRTIRLKGQGMPRFKGEGTGDLYVRVRVVLPTDLSDEAKKAAKRFLDLVDQPDPRS